MTKIINGFEPENPIGEDILKYLSPFRTDHINRFGVFQLDIDKKPSDLEYEIELTKKKSK